MDPSYSSSAIARQTWELENNVVSAELEPTPTASSSSSSSSSDLIFYYDEAAQTKLQQQRPWAQDPHYFKRVKISAHALLKMVIHARSGGTIEVMGLMQGKTEGVAIVVMDAFSLPVEGTETRVNAQADAYEYMVEYSQTSKQVGRLENVVGWYHSHPEVAEKGTKVWEQMQSGAIELMRKYVVQTCGYCYEVQVGPKGHRVRQCQAFKHQMRDGQHAWQETTIDDLVPPVYVWHVQNHQADALVDALKRCYGKLPAVVELFAQAGAKVEEGYTGVMREDIVVPALDEEQLVV